MLNRLFLMTVGVLATATAAAAPTLSGSYFADFSSSTDPDVAMAGKLQQMALVFEGKEVFMEVGALGEKKRVRTQASFDDETVRLRLKNKQRERLVLGIRNAGTLECLECPEGMPRYWKRSQTAAD